MDDFFFILVLAALAIPIIAIVALVVALSQRSLILRLDQRLRALELERRAPEPLTAQVVPAAASAPPPAETAPAPAPAIESKTEAEAALSAGGQHTGRIAHSTSAATIAPAVSACGTAALDRL